MKPLLIFDMDGVLAEVTASYRAAVVETVYHFTGQQIDNGLIQSYKNMGGWNNDWALSQRICADLGVEVSYEEVVAYFCDVFFGDAMRPGLILREEWIPRDGLLERLSARFQLGIFTGRLRNELRPTLERFAARLAFDPVLCSGEIPRGKPAPDGLLLIKEQAGERPVFYVGDTVDDARSALDAGVPFIGISAPAGERREELRALFAELKAIAILDDVNQIEEVLPA